MTEPARELVSMDEVKEAITARGRERGFVTSEDLLEAVPVEDFTPEQVEDFLTQVQDHLTTEGIEIIEVPGEEIAAARTAHAGDERAPAQLPEELLEIRERDALPLADPRQRHRAAALGLGHGEIEDGGDGEAPFRGQTHVCLQFYKCFRGAKAEECSQVYQELDRFGQPFGAARVEAGLWRSRSRGATLEFGTK